MSSVLTFSQVPQHLTFLADVKTLLDLVHSCHVCYGNGDERLHFVKGWKDNESSRYCVIYYDDPYA